MPSHEELDELILIDDDNEEEEVELLDEEEHKTKKSSSSNKYIIISIISLLLILALLGVYFILNQNEEIEPIDTNSSKIIKNIKKHKSIAKPITNLDLLTQKANKLYNSGKKEEALKIYKKISNFHKYLSIFNLGVSNLQKNDFKKAISYFEKSLEFKELSFESSFNLSICYKSLKNDKMFKYYLNKADELIINKYNSPLFNYYYALIYYYKNKPIESTILLNRYKEKYFSYDKDLLYAKNYTILEDYPKAVNHLINLKDSNYYFIIGQLYSNFGRYDLAQNYFLKSINSKKEIKKSLVALSLAQNKLGMFKDCSSTLKTISQKYPDATKLFPINVKIKESLYDPLKAQKEFKNSIFADKFNKFSLLFYFAPYKLFDPKQANSLLKKGVKEIYIDNINLADDYLKEASSISEINTKIVEGLKLLQEHKVYEANKLFKKLIKLYPNHSILHYNLALTYANINNFQKAKKHFEKSYLLDKTNYLSAFFSAFCSILTNTNYDDKSITKLVKHSSNEQIILLYKILQDDPTIHLSLDKEESSFELILNIILSNLSNNYKNYQYFTDKLYKMMPKDLVTNILYVDMISQNGNIKDYAKNVQNYLAIKSLDKKPLLYGETIARELYIKVLSIAGITRFAKELLENELPTNQNQVALLQSLAYTYIYTKDYEKAYKIYNNLIDNLKADDTHTLLLASVASIGANHHANAIALQELANIDNRTLYESRYALGVLYQEAKNFEGASIQFSKIGNSGYKPKYFDFDLKK